MKTIKNMASTAKKSATIIAMAAIAGTSVNEMESAARQAMQDMKAAIGDHAYSVGYTWDPFDGFVA